ncbi:ABC-2 family transporter protein [Caulifigura coniformis]|uniref:ABC-2 family transporter protein n=1 Tax=Caulifigura coniformis TaxID=2527983 RepID=A0A517SG13_9PLAN|nr:ABC transporter permease subunit/CPBP intramembrane protease [Caulifigura coniformis]QDT55075.1 ABC-2 family transporter protein [Caulifigura coniformis]
MNWRNVKLIFWREVSDQLRDRRTLFMVVLLPLFLYPILGVGMMEMTVTFTEQPRTVVVLNADDLPEPQLIKEGRFLAQYFKSPDDLDKIHVLTDDARTKAASLSEEEQAFLEGAKERLPKIEELGRLVLEARSLSPKADAARSAEISSRADELRTEISNWFENAPVQVLVIVPPGLKQQVKEINEALAKGDRSNGPRELPAHPMLLENSADEKSAIAFRRVRDVFSAWEDDVLRSRLEQAELPLSISAPVDPVTVDLARSEKLSANVWAKMFPALLVMMAVTGAFYPAIDLGAGEKERGTMETLLISPASRKEIVTGKFLTVMLFSISTALLNIASIGYTGKHMLSARPGGPNSAADVAFPGFEPLMWVVLLSIPLAALFSALSLAFAMFARSTKEGQYYLTPLLMVTMGLMMFSLNPAVELTPFYSVLPVVGPSLLLKALILGSAPGGSLPFFAVAVTISSICYSLLALWWAIEQFQREDVLFRDAERFDLRLWFRHLLRKKEDTPSFSEALFCFVLILMLQFASFNIMRDRLLDAQSDTMALQLQMIYLLATVATPALMMAVMLTSNPLKTLKLRGCHLKWIGAAIVLPVVLQPLALELLSRLHWFFPPLPPGMDRIMKSMSTHELPLWLPFLAFAVTPAICEELAFRGFILSGLQRTHRYRLAAVMSSIAFGIVHMIPQQVFNATLLGLVLAALALRSGSLIPGIIFHLIFNGLQVVAARMLTVPSNLEALKRWGIYEAEATAASPQFTWGLLGGCAVIAAPLLWWLVQGPVAKGWRDAHSGNGQAAKPYDSTVPPGATTA